jgi:type III restriction enzyme
MSLPDQIARYMSLREPQTESLQVLHEIADGLEFRTTSLKTVGLKASEKSRAAKPVEFDTEFPSFCFALATGVGKTRLMGASIYYLWKSKGYRNFFILAPGMTIYDKLRAELEPSHPKYMFVGLSDFPRPDAYDGDNYRRYSTSLFDEKQAHIFVFNIGKIFSPRTDRQFKFHRPHELIGGDTSFADVLRQMGDLVVLMDESHRYRGDASLKAINDLKPALGLEYTATPTYKKNVVYEFGLARSIGRFVKTPTVITRSNLTTSDAEEMERMKLLDGMARHEMKKGQLAEYCAANGYAQVKPFVLVSTKDTTHAGEVRALVESDAFCEGRYKGKVIEIHSGKTGAESDENVQRLLEVEQPTSTVEIVIHVNMLKEGWDVNNLYTIIPLRASVSDILTEQTIGRGLRLPFGVPTGVTDLDELEIVSHDQYARLIAEAKNSPLFRFREIPESELRQVKTVPVQHDFVDMDKVLVRLQQGKEVLFTSDLSNEQLMGEVVDTLVCEEAAAFEQRREAEEKTTKGEKPVGPVQEALFDVPAAEKAGKFDKEAAAKRLRERLRLLVERNIDVPDIVMEVTSERKLEPFEIRVTRGPFVLVDQHLVSTELQSGIAREGERVEVLAVDNPRGFLAGRVIDAIEEMDVPSDKEAVLGIVDSYLAKLEIPAEDLGKIVHLYRDTIVEDMKTQVEAHLRDETKETPRVRSGFVRFRPYAKTVLAKEGVVPFDTDVPKGDVRKYLFTGYRKSLYSQVAFDSTPEKDFAALLEQDGGVLRWIRPPDGNVPIYYGGRPYNPDFIVETKEGKFVVEVKARNEVTDADVLAKARAATRWCAEASKLPGSKPWSYKLVPDDDILPGRDFAFIISHAVRVQA